MGVKATDTEGRQSGETNEASGGDGGGDSPTSAAVGVGPGGDGTTPLPLDQVFDVLRNERRRRALAYLLENDGWATMSELAERVAAYETGKPVEELTSSERKRVYVALYQCHLPKMDDVDVIEFNKARGVIELGGNAAALNRYLEDAQELRTGEPWRGDDDSPETGRPWPQYYAAIVLGGAALALLSLSAGGVAMQVVLGFVLLAVGATSVLHFRDASHALSGRPLAGED